MARVFGLGGVFKVFGMGGDNLGRRLLYSGLVLAYASHFVFRIWLTRDLSFENSHNQVMQFSLIHFVTIILLVHAGTQSEGEGRATAKRRWVSTPEIREANKESWKKKHVAENEKLERLKDME